MTRSREEPRQQDLAKQYQQLCRGQDALPDVSVFLSSVDVPDLEARAAVLLVDQAERIARGCLRPAEEYFAEFAEVAASTALSLKLAAAEFHRRTAQGEAIPRETFLARFPQLRIHLEQLLDPVPSSDPQADSVRLGSSEATVDVPMASLQQEAADKTLKLPEDSILGESPATQDNGSENKALATEEWEPADQESLANGNPVDANDTLKLDSDSLHNMMDEFDTGHISALGQSAEMSGKDKGASFPDTLFAEGAAYDPSRPLGAFGKYDLLGEIARGGMGVVFKARQRGLNRIVALKMILAGRLADEDDIRRFYAEAEAAAGLDHPNIVPIYEVGQYRGQHFFSMGIVEGQSLAELIAEHPLSAKEAAGMIKTIAEAVHYAHQHGIIHRDLKPANVLLDGQGQPKITDFGLAKRTEAEANLTTTGQLLGTPSYMSPEQIQGDSSQVGPPSDVFALGALLYCLLTGRPPFQAPTVLELLKQVQESEPVSPQRLTANLPADLETICLKCLEKETHRRYESAQALADDLDRFLRGVPVVARPVSSAERLWRWCKRHPAVAGLSAAFLCSLMLGAGFSTYYAIAAGKRAQEALEQFERAETNFQRAERNFQMAQAAVDQFFIQVSENTLLNQPGMQPLQQKLLGQALEYYQEFLKERGDDPELQDELAMTFFRVGIITEIVESPAAAIEPLETARTRFQELLKSRPDDRELQKHLGDALTALGRVYYRAKSVSAAGEAFQRAASLREELAQELPNDQEAHRQLANAYMNQGLMERERAKNPAESKMAMDKAVAFYNQAQDLRRTILKDSGLSSEMLRKVRRDLGQGGYNLGRIYLQMGNKEAGLKSYRDAAIQLERSLEFDEEDQNSRLQLAICYHELAVETVDPKQAWDDSERALSHLSPLAIANPRVTDYKKKLASLQWDRGNIARDAKKFPDALLSFHETWKLTKELRKEGQADARMLLIGIGSYRSILEFVLGGQKDSLQPPRVEELAELTEDLGERLQAKSTSGRLRSEFVLELFQLGNLLGRKGQSELAAKLARQGVELTEKLILEDAANLDHRFNQHLGLELLGRLLAENQQLDDARIAYESRLKALTELSALLPDSADSAVERAKLSFAKAQTNNVLARILLTQNQPARAKAELEAAQKLITALVLQLPAYRQVFQQELDQTNKMLEALSQPAKAEKPRTASDGGPP